MEKRRNRRIDEAVKQGVAELIKEEFGDPRLALVTITDAEVSEDHAYATVYYATVDRDIVSDEGRSDRLPSDDQAADALASAAPRLQGLLSRRLRLRNTPVLRFTPDSAVAEGRRIDELLRRVRAEDDARAADREQPPSYDPYGADVPTTDPRDGT
jgi:ribosome-binding factor A